MALLGKAMFNISACVHQPAHPVDIDNLFVFSILLHCRLSSRTPKVSPHLYVVIIPSSAHPLRYTSTAGGSTTPREVQICRYFLGSTSRRSGAPHLLAAVKTLGRGSCTPYIWCGPDSAMAQIP